MTPRGVRALRSCSSQQMLPLFLLAGTAVTTPNFAAPRLPAPHRVRLLQMQQPTRRGDPGALPWQPPSGSTINPLGVVPPAQAEAPRAAPSREGDGWAGSGLSAAQALATAQAAASKAAGAVKELEHQRQVRLLSTLDAVGHALPVRSLGTSQCLARSSTSACRETCLLLCRLQHCIHAACSNPAEAGTLSNPVCRRHGCESMACRQTASEYELVQRQIRSLLGCRCKRSASRPCPGRMPLSSRS